MQKKNVQNFLELLVYLYAIWISKRDKNYMAFQKFYDHRNLFFYGIAFGKCSIVGSLASKNFVLPRIIYFAIFTMKIVFVPFLFFSELLKVDGFTRFWLYYGYEI